MPITDLRPGQGSGGGGAATDATITMSDVTTNNASTTKHGFLKKLSNVAGEYMSGTGVWTTVVTVALAGLITTNPSIITSGDTIVGAMGKLQAQILARFNPSITSFKFDDLGGVISFSGISSGGAINQGILGLSGDGYKPGVVRVRVTNVGNYAGWVENTNTIMFGAGAWTAQANQYFNTLSDATEGYIWRFGFGDSISANDETDGAYFEYDSSQSTFFRICTAQAGTRTKQNTTVAVVAAKWYDFGVVVNAAGTSVEYFINGTSVGTLTTNIPTGTNFTGFKVMLQKTVGATARDIHADYLRYGADWTSGTRYTP